MIDLPTLKRIADALRGGTDVAYSAIVTAVSDHQEAEPTPQRTEMDTLGSLFDKLVTVDLKMWNNQERLYEIRRMTPEAFRDAWGDELGALHEVVKRCCDLNIQRASLMDEIDQYLHDAVSGKKPTDELMRKQHKTY